MFLSEKSELGLAGAFYYRLASDQLERVSDHAGKIAGIILESGEKIPHAMLTDIVKISVISYKLVNDSVVSFTKCNLELANSIIDEHKKIGEDLRRIRHPSTSMNPDAVMSLGLIADSVKRIGDYAANIAELAIDFSKSI